MLLTPQEQERFTPGIYRTSFSHVNGVPGLRDAEFESAEIDTILKKLRLEDMTNKGFSELITGNEKPIEKGDWPKRTYFPSIDSFLDAWKKGYETKISQFGTNQFYEQLGFELFYVNWKPGSDFHNIGDHKGVKYVRDRADLDPKMILGDNNGMNDQNGYLNLGVNDFRTQRALVYREFDKDGYKTKNEGTIDLTPNNPKLLRGDIRYYVWTSHQEFPIKSPNSLKSAHNMWTTIGIDPKEIYAAIERMGFVFPPSINAMP